MTEWNKDMEKKILRRSRFSLALRILRILIILLFIYVIYMTIINITADKLNIGNENKYYSSLALEWTIPNVRGDSTANQGETTAFGTNKLSYDLIKRVGLKEVVVGEAQLNKQLFDTFSTFTYSHPGLQGLSELSFSLPEDPRTNKKLDANTHSHVWNTLEMLSEGTVAELAFSTPEFMEADELVESFQDYDLHILWMPLYTGEFVDYSPNSWGGGSNTLGIVDLIGLTGGINHDESYHQSFRYYWLEAGSLEESKQLMLENMEGLLNKSESYYEGFLGLSHLEKRYNHLKEEGFIVYGAVVTGPVKELLKLREAPFVRGEQLGEVELWNWELQD